MPRRRAISVSALVCAAFFALLLAPGALAARPAGKLVPPTGALVGAFVDRGLDGWHQSEVTDFERLIGRKLAIDHRYKSWQDAFPGADESWDVANGRIPMLTWEPWGTRLDAIRNGSWDELIRARADGLRDLGSPVFLRFAHEMNGDWYPWDGSHNNSRGRKDGPRKYVSAWRHVHDVFAEEGATNVVWVWCPNRSSFPTARWNDFRRYYPGDAYVDWVCIDGYNFGASEDWSLWRSFENVFAPIYDAYAGIKPIMIGETATVESGGSKAQWIRDAETAMKNRFPDLAAFLWFNIDKGGHDWRVDSSTESLAAFRSLVSDPYFAVDSPGAAATVVTGPAVSGVPEVGSTLSAPSSESAEAASLAYSWARCDAWGTHCATIPGAADSVYTMSDADRGHRIRAVVTDDAGSAAVTAASRATGVVQPHLHVFRLGVRLGRVRSARISFRLTRSASVSVLIRNAHGRVIRHRRRHVQYPAGRVHLKWRGRTDFGARAHAGRYRAVVVAEPPPGSPSEPRTRAAAFALRG